MFKETAETQVTREVKIMSEDQAMAVLASANMLPAEPVNAEEELAWAEIDRIFTGRPQPVKFAALGDTVTGQVVRGYTRQKTKFGTEEPEWWDDGSPKLEAVIELLTPEGLRSLYVSSWRMQNALSAAFADAGVRGPRAGGAILVKYISDEPVKGSANAAKVYEAAYEPPREKTRSEGGSQPSPILRGPVATLGVGGPQPDEPPF